MSYHIPYSFTAKVWQHNSTGGWYFVSLPKEMAKEIRSQLKCQEEGWGRLKAKAELKTIQWETAIWFDTKADTYILPLKADIRKKGNIRLHDSLEITVYI